MTATDGWLSRRRLLQLTGTGAAAAAGGLAGCLDGGSGGGGTDTDGRSEFRSAVSDLDFGADYERRRGATFEDWPVEKRTQTPSGNRGDAGTWLDSTSVRSAPWTPPEGWEDTPAGDVDEITILNYGDMRFDPATAAVDALFEELRDGVLSVVSTDHVPLPESRKTDGPWWESAFGVNSLQVSLPVFHDEAVRNRGLSYPALVRLLCTAPARTFGLPRKGRIEPGADADLVVVDLANPREIEAGALHGAAGWTPFEGLRGVFPELTTVRGEVVYERDPVTGAESFGEPVGRNVREA